MCKNFNYRTSFLHKWIIFQIMKPMSCWRHVNRGSFSFRWLMLWPSRDRSSKDNPTKTQEGRIQINNKFWIQFMTRNLVGNAWGSYSCFFTDFPGDALGDNLLLKGEDQDNCLEWCHWCSWGWVQTFWVEIWVEEISFDYFSEQEAHNLEKRKL